MSVPRLSRLSDVVTIRVTIVCLPFICLPLSRMVLCLFCLFCLFLACFAFFCLFWPFAFFALSCLFWPCWPFGRFLPGFAFWDFARLFAFGFLCDGDIRGGAVSFLPFCPFLAVFALCLFGIFCPSLPFAPCGPFLGHLGRVLPFGALPVFLPFVFGQRPR